MMVRPASSVRSYGRRHAYEHSPRLPLRGDIDRDRKQRPLYPTHIAP